MRALTSREIIAGYALKIRTIFQNNAGQGAAYNAGWLAARGEFVLFLDSDDVLVRDAVSKIVLAFQDNDAVKVQFYLGLTDRNLQPLGLLLPSYDFSAMATREQISSYGYYVSPPASGNAFGGGWTVWVDSNGNGSFDTAEPLLRSHEALPSTILIGDGTITSITFNPTGFLTAGALDIKLCATDPALASFDITIQANGLTDVADVAGHAGSMRSTCS